MYSPTRTSTAALLHRFQHGLSEHPVQLIYTPSGNWPLKRTPHASSILRPLQISILDSSFNPPTLAHLALAKVPLSSNVDFDAKLLLLSVRNVDKSLKPGDASFVQRIEMMRLLAEDISNSPTLGEHPNVAVAIIDEPTFIGKSRKLLAFLNQRLASLSTNKRIDQPQLTFLMGFDTLERLLSPRYYTPPSNPADSAESTMLVSLRKFLSSDSSSGDNSRVICARRVTPNLRAGEEIKSQALTLAQEFVKPGYISIIDIGEDERTYSSSEVREKVAVGNADWKRLVSHKIAQSIADNGLYRTSV